MSSTDPTTKRRIARLDYAFRVLNGGRLPRFKGWVYSSLSSAGDYIGWVIPYDGTPETAFDILRRTCKGSNMRPLFIGLTLEDESVTTINKVCPQFYQGISMWKEEF